MNKVIVTTSINSPTEAIQKFDAMKDWTLVVVPDQKTPPDYKLERGHYLSLREQELLDQKLSEAIGWNCIQRRNMGFLYAMKEMKADIVATVDDDNIPDDHWGKGLMVGKEVTIRFHETHEPAFDPFYVTSKWSCWHRGFPLQLVHSRSTVGKEKFLPVIADVQADFWDGDPDVDAVCRMIYNPIHNFDVDSFPFFANKISPFNSQNTFLSAKVMPHYFMYPGVGRMDDIWASFHVQQQGFKVVYGKPSVRQVRNPHDLTKDMKAEYLGYEHNLSIIRGGSVEPFLPEQAKLAFRLYQKHYE